MEEQVARLVKKVEGRLTTLLANERLLIAVSGIPGSGKTTLAALVAARLNANATTKAATAGVSNNVPTGSAIAMDVEYPSSTTPLATTIPMDGYHLTRAQLSQLPDPAEAFRRRGAAFTFDAPAFLALVKKLRIQKPGDETIYAPSFDHAKKDPVEGGVQIAADVRVLIFEGLYLSLGPGKERSGKEGQKRAIEWAEAGKLMDEQWFVEVPLEVARRRLVARHVESGICGSVEEAKERVDGSDMVNGKEILEGRVEGINEFIVSIEDERWAIDGPAESVRKGMEI